MNRMLQLAENCFEKFLETVQMVEMLFATSVSALPEENPLRFYKNDLFCQQRLSPQNFANRFEKFPNFDATEM